MSETWFKVAFVLAFVALAVVGGRTAKRASRTHGASVNQLQNEVKGLLIVRGVLGAVFYAMIAVWFFFPQILRWTWVPIPASGRLIAMVLLLPVMAFLVWSFRAIGTNYRGGIGLYEKHELVTSGPYSIMRHPIYISFILIMALVTAISSNWLLGLSGLVLVTMIPIRRIPTEEAELRERFGESWDKYSARTRMLFPG